MSKGERKKQHKIPNWDHTKEEELIETHIPCNMHSFINTFILSVLCLFNVVFFSTHLDATLNTPIVYSFVITHMDAGDTSRFPEQSKSIPHVIFGKVIDYSVCCKSKKTHLHCFDDTVLRNENGEVFVSLSTPIPLNNIYCKVHIKMH